MRPIEHLKTPRGLGKLKVEVLSPSSEWFGTLNNKRSLVRGASALKHLKPPSLLRHKEEELSPRSEPLKTFKTTESPRT